jgi:hypothetical protein
VKVSRSLTRLAFGSGLVVALGLGVSSSACDERFQFDMPVAGAGATSATAGAAFGGAASSGTAGSGAESGLGGTAASGAAAGGTAPGGTAPGGTASGGTASGGSAEAGASSTGCGDVAACPADLHCSDGLCVQCTEDADCAAYALPRCEPTRHRCVPCVTTADCEAGYACDSLANRCLKKCVEDDTCVGQHGCDERRFVCYQCDEDRECLTSSVGSLCASDGSGCVQCRRDTDCPGQHCDQLFGRCVDCRDGLDCDSRLCSPTTFTCLPD